MGAPPSGSRGCALDRSADPAKPLRSRGGRLLLASLGDSCRPRSASLRDAWDADSKRATLTRRLFLSYAIRTVSTPDQVHACRMMIRVQTVSIVAKNKYSGKAGGLPHPTRGGTKVRKPLTKVTMLAATMFASRFGLNGSSRLARIMA